MKILYFCNNILKYYNKNAKIYQEMRILIFDSDEKAMSAH